MAADLTAYEHVLDELDVLVKDELKMVSFKWLSRQFGLSVNVAKRLLQKYVDRGTADVTPVYLVAGWTNEEPAARSIVLTTADKLPGVRERLRGGRASAHVYSVQMSVPKDPAALWAPEFAQAEELLRQPPDVDNCLRDNRHSSVVSASVVRDSNWRARAKQAAAAAAVKPAIAPPRPLKAEEVQAAPGGLGPGSAVASKATGVKGQEREGVSDGALVTAGGGGAAAEVQEASVGPPPPDGHAAPSGAAAPTAKQGATGGGPASAPGKKKAAVAAQKPAGGRTKAFATFFNKPAARPKSAAAATASAPAAPAGNDAAAAPALAPGSEPDASHHAAASVSVMAEDEDNLMAMDASACVRARESPDPALGGSQSAAPGTSGLDAAGGERVSGGNAKKEMKEEEEEEEDEGNTSMGAAEFAFLRSGKAGGEPTAASSRRRRRRRIDEDEAEEEGEGGEEKQEGKEEAGHVGGESLTQGDDVSGAVLIRQERSRREGGTPEGAGSNGRSSKRRKSEGRVVEKELKQQQVGKGAKKLEEEEEKEEDGEEAEGEGEGEDEEKMGEDVDEDANNDDDGDLDLKEKARQVGGGRGNGGHVAVGRKPAGGSQAAEAQGSKKRVPGGGTRTKKRIIEINEKGREETKDVYVDENGDICANQEPDGDDLHLRTRRDAFSAEQALSSQEPLPASSQPKSTPPARHQTPTPGGAGVAPRGSTAGKRGMSKPKGGGPAKGQRGINSFFKKS